MEEKLKKLLEGQNGKKRVLFTGPMKSEKSYNLLLLIGDNNTQDIIIKSSIDKRSDGIKSRKMNKYHKASDITIY